MSVIFDFDSQISLVSGQGMREISGKITVADYTQYVASPLAGEKLTDLLAKFSKDYANTSKLKELFFENELGTTGELLLWTYVWPHERLLIYNLTTAAQASAGVTYTTRFMARGAL